MYLNGTDYLYRTISHFLTFCLLFAKDLIYLLHKNDDDNLFMIIILR